MKVYNYSKAKRLFTQYLKIKEIPEVYYYRGLCSYKQSKWKAASDDFWIASRKATDEDDFKADAEELYELANAKHEEIVERRRETWAEIGRTVGEALLVTTAVVADAYLQTQYGVSTMPYSYSISTYGTSFASVPTYSGVASMSDTQFNQYINSELTSLMAVTMQQVEQQQAAEYMNFATYNKKTDGTDYTREEYNMMKGQALYEMKMQDTGSTSTYQSEHDESNGSGIKRDPRVQENIDYWKETYGDKECKFCRGTGKCANCNGKGVCSAGFGLGEMACPNCLHGHLGKCSHCQGDGIVYGHKGI